MCFTISKAHSITCSMLLAVSPSWQSSKLRLIQQKNLNHLTCSFQASRLLWTSKSSDEPAGDLHHPHHLDQSRQRLGSVGLPPPSPRNSFTKKLPSHLQECLPSPSHHHLLLKVCQDMVLLRAWQVQAHPLPGGSRPEKFPGDCNKVSSSVDHMLNINLQLAAVVMLQGLITPFFQGYYLATTADDNYCVKENLGWGSWRTSTPPATKLSSILDEQITIFHTLDKIITHCSCLRWRGLYFNSSGINWRWHWLLPLEKATQIIVNMTSSIATQRVKLMIDC